MHATNNESSFTSLSLSAALRVRWAFFADFSTERSPLTVSGAFGSPDVCTEALCALACGSLGTCVNRIEQTVSCERRFWTNDSPQQPTMSTHKDREHESVSDVTPSLPSLLLSHHLIPHSRLCPMRLARARPPPAGWDRTPSKDPRTRAWLAPARQRGSSSNSWTVAPECDTRWEPPLSPATHRSSRRSSN